jgi:hypothetical protein
MPTIGFYLVTPLLAVFPSLGNNQPFGLPKINPLPDCNDRKEGLKFHCRNNAEVNYNRKFLEGGKHHGTG